MRRLLVIVALVAAACSGSDADEPAANTTDESGPTTTTVTEAGPPTTVSLVVPVGDISANHIDPPAVFDQAPSIGGDHYPFWHNCGFYTVELLEGAATHSMEHGAVWITYNADLIGTGGLDTLRAMSEANEKLLISPYPHDEPIVASAWGAQLRTSGAADSVEVMAFIDEWIDNPELPEAGVTCQQAAGVPPDDARTLSDGSQVPDEWN